MVDTPSPFPLQARATLDEAQAEVAEKLSALSGALSKKRARPRGIYLWGAVGRGKSMLMDDFFAAAPEKRKRRVHFHAFMQETHAAIHRIRKDKSGDPVMTLVSEIARDTRLLCFDELQANDVADATLLFRLFSGLFDAGVVIVATSNRAPEDIYQGVVQAERFAAFIALIQQRMEALSLNGDTDYRRRAARADEATYFTPPGEAADRFIAAHLQGREKREVTLHVHGRALNLSAYGDAALASFHELCETALGAADYLAVAKAFPTLILTGIPLLSPENRNAARRFTTLVDALYENRVRLIATAAALPDALYPAGDGSFEFRRTASRLIEMQSKEYFNQSAEKQSKIL